MQYKNECKYCTFSVSFTVNEDDPLAGDSDVFNYLKGITDQLINEHMKKEHPQTP